MKSRSITIYDRSNCSPDPSVTCAALTVHPDLGRCGLPAVALIVCDGEAHHFVCPLHLGLFVDDEFGWVRGGPEVAPPTTPLLTVKETN